MSSKNSKTGSEYQSKISHGSCLRSKNSIEQERKRKLVKFNAIADIKELSDDSTDIKLNMGGKQNSASSSETKEQETTISFHSKRRNHYKNEFTNSKTSKHEDQD